MLRACCFLAVWLGSVSISFGQFGVAIGDGFDQIEEVRGMSKERMKKIDAALARKVYAAFYKAPLEDVVKFLRDKYGAPILIDQGALDLLGIGADAPITINADGVRLDNFLSAVARSIDAQWTVDKGYIQITDWVDVPMISVIYDVRPLVSPRGSSDVVYSDSLPTFEYNELTEFIVNTIDVISWEHLGGGGSLQTYSLGEHRLLMIRQTYQNQRKIAFLLNHLKSKLKDQQRGKGKKKKRGFSIVYKVDPPEETSPDDLARIIQSTIADASWKKKHAIKVIGDAIVVNQPARVHFRVKQLLITLDVLAERPAVSDQGLF